MSQHNLYQRAKSLFLDAVKQSPAEVEPWLRERCGEDTALFAAVRELLHNDSEDNISLHDPERTRILGRNFAVSNDMDDAHGETIDHYVCKQHLGSGGYADVYLASDLSADGRDVAVKVLRGQGELTQQETHRFELECNVMAGLTHPGIARLYRRGITNRGRPYYAMEYVSGSPITRFVKEHKLTLEQVLDIFVKVCTAVHSANSLGIIHRDLKPANILVTSEGEEFIPKVIDFGVAKVPPALRLHITNTGEWVGTPAYMSPEQIEARRDSIDARTDVYALGLILFELLCG